jgi:hypothetical protein
MSSPGRTYPTMDSEKCTDRLCPRPKQKNLTVTGERLLERRSPSKCPHIPDRGVWDTLVDWLGDTFCGEEVDHSHPHVNGPVFCDECEEYHEYPKCQAKMEKIYQWSADVPSSLPRRVRTD